MSLLLLSVELRNRTRHYKIIVKEIKSETSTARESRESIDAVKNKLIAFRAKDELRLGIGLRGHRA